jgi:hypothetical protein
LSELRTKTVSVKMVDRIHPAAISFRTVKSGFYLGSAGCNLLFFPMPSEEVLRTEHYTWWRSAQM